MKPIKESTDSRKQKRHKSTMPRIQTLKSAKKARSKTNKKFVDSNKWNRFYQNKAWKKLREAKLLEQPLCEECLNNGIVRAAVDVHHRIRFSTGVDEQEQWELFLDYNNLMSLCKQCHRRIHQQHWKRKKKE